MTILSTPHNPATPNANDLTPVKLFESLRSLFSKVEKSPSDILAAQLRRTDARRAVDNLLR
ncbi:MAG: hypothetical protein HRU33_12110 [Rhodobacteraceae bacterium]|nr:hypothetical protein [Paracoccaceae bacterium]